MSTFKEMDTAEALKAIEGYSDVLTPEAVKYDAFYRQHKCPRCRSSLQKEFDSKHTFLDPDVMVPRALLRCSICKYLLDPHNNLVVQYGDPSKIPLESLPIIDPKKG